MKRGESVAVIYLSLLVCLALGQGSEGGGGGHNTTLVALHTFIHTQKYMPLIMGITQNCIHTPRLLFIQTSHHDSPHLPFSLSPYLNPIPTSPSLHPSLPQVLVPSRGGMHKTMTPLVLQLRC